MWFDKGVGILVGICHILNLAMSPQLQNCSSLDRFGPPERVWRSTWLDFSSQGPPFTSVVDTLSSGGKVPLKEGRDELDFWLVLATIGKKGKSSPPGLEALLEIYGSSC